MARNGEPALSKIEQAIIYCAGWRAELWCYLFDDVQDIFPETTEEQYHDACAGLVKRRYMQDRHAHMPDDFRAKRNIVLYDLTPKGRKTLKGITLP